MAMWIPTGINPHQHPTVLTFMRLVPAGHFHSQHVPLAGARDHRLARLQLLPAPLLNPLTVNTNPQSIILPGLIMVMWIPTDIDPPVNDRDPSLFKVLYHIARLSVANAGIFLPYPIPFPMFPLHPLPMYLLALFPNVVVPLLPLNSGVLLLLNPIPVSYMLDFVMVMQGVIRLILLDHLHRHQTPMSLSLSNVNLAHFHLSVQSGNLHFGGVGLAKEETLIENLKHAKLYLCGIAEHRWSSTGSRKVNGWTIVQTAINEHSARLMSIRIPIGNVFTGGSHFYTVIVGYAPQQEDIVKRVAFFKALQSLIQKVSAGDVLFILSDMNSGFGTEAVEGVVGPHGHGRRNPGGDELITFCQQMNLRIMNTFFQKPSNRALTWYHPAWHTGKLIDYCTVRSRDAKYVCDVEACPGYECDTDHRLLHRHRKITIKKFAVYRLKDPSVKAQYQLEISKALANISGEDWPTLRDSVNRVAKNVLGTQSKNRADWKVEHASELEELSKIKYDMY
eukprot:gene2456-2526_t